MKPQTLLPALLLIVLNATAQNTSSGSQSLAQRYDEKNNFPVRIFVAAGVALNNLEMTGSSTFYETQIDHETKTSFAVQLGAKCPIRSTRGALLISPRVSFYSLDAYGEADLLSGLSTFHHASSVKAKLIIKPSALIGYSILNKPGARCYIAAGPGFQFFAGGEELQVTTFSSGNQKVVENKPEPLVIVIDTELGFDVGSHLGVMVNYQPAANIFRYIDKKGMLSTVQATLAWSF